MAHPRPNALQPSLSRLSHKESSPAAIVYLAIFALLSGCGDATDSYFPLDRGWRWAYDLDVTTMDGAQHRKFMVENMGAIRHEGLSLKVRRSGEGTLTYFKVDEQGVLRIAESRPETGTEIYASPRVALPAKLEPSATWTDTEFTVTLEHTGPPEHSLNRITVPVDMHFVIEATDDTVTVPAGHFERCVRIRGVGETSKNVGFYVGQTDIRIENTEWYAPGAGLIKAVRRETTTSSVLSHGSYDLQLTSLTR